MESVFKVLVEYKQKHLNDISSDKGIVLVLKCTFVDFAFAIVPVVLPLFLLLLCCYAGRFRKKWVIFVIWKTLIVAVITVVATIAVVLCLLLRYCCVGCCCCLHFVEKVRALEKYLEDFERNGLYLSSESRTDLGNKKKQLSDWCLQFNRSITTTN